jgi:hypothetical protein
MFRILVFLLVACALGGCDRFAAAFSSPGDRITSAFPISDEIALASKRLFEATTTADADKATANVVKDRYAKMLQVRALTCTATVDIGRLDTAADIRKKVTSTACFTEQDRQLSDWIGIQRVAAAMQKPALVPLVALPPSQTLAPAPENTVGITTSSASNVAVLRSSRGSLTTVSLPSGKAMQTFAADDYSHTGLELSPNGRVLARPRGSNRGLAFFDIESGTVLWSTDKYLRLYSWLPAVNGLVMTQSAQGQAAVLVDALNGEATAYLSSERRPSWSVPIPGDGNQTLIGGYNTAMVMDHAREADGTLTARQLDQWRLVKPVASGTPFLMRGGKRLVYVTAAGLAWANLETGDQGGWDTTTLRGSGYAKLDDALIYFSASTDGSMRNEGKVLDVDAQTIAPDLKYQQADGPILSLSPRNGFMRRGDAVIIGSAIDTGPPEDLSKIISNAQLVTQLAKLNALTSGQGRESMAGSSTQMPQVQPMLTQVPAHAEVAAIGVYESKSGTHSAAGPRSPGFIRVTVAPASTPLVLVLTNYEPVRWIVQNNGRKISAVLLSGYQESSVLGLTDVPILKIGSTHAYKMDGPEYARLKLDVARYVSNPVRTFQGSYSGQEFMVSSFR